MKRNLMKQLLAWRQKLSRKPLILCGVRQTGKTYLLKAFGEQHFQRVHHINFEQQPNLKTLFEHDLQPKRIIDELQFTLKTSIDRKHDLLIFDEIQACPLALTSLKYFCEDLPELALCAAGSLLGLHLNDTAFPVGKVDIMHLHPLVFSEFLRGIGDDHAADFLQQYTPGQAIPALHHEHFWRRFKHYLITGGLPEVINTFRDHQDDLYDAFAKVRLKQDNLIVGYYADIAKHAGKLNAMQIDRTWRAVPMQLAANYEASSSRFRFKGILPTINRYRQLVHVIDWLTAAELVIRLPIVGAFELPLNAYTKENLFKLMLFDVGLLGAMNAMPPESIVSYDFGTYKGYVAENFVAQQLTATLSTPLYSWQQDRSEIEFVLPHGNSILPIEVKSSHVTRAKSLEKFINYYHPQKSIILSAQPAKTNQQQTLIYLPLYCAEKIASLKQ